MADLPIRHGMLPVISSMSIYAAGPQISGGSSGGGGSQNTYPVANLGFFVPFWLPNYYPVRSLWIANGGTVNGNLDIGIYTVDGTKLLSLGSTAMSGASALQITSVTETVLSPGRYYMAFSSSSSTATFAAKSTDITALNAAGVIQASSQLPLATAPTLATLGQAYLPLFGISSLTSGY